MDALPVTASMSCPLCGRRVAPATDSTWVVAWYSCPRCGHDWSARIRNGRRNRHSPKTHPRKCCDIGGGHDVIERRAKRACRYGPTTARESTGTGNSRQSTPRSWANTFSRPRANMSRGRSRTGTSYGIAVTATCSTTLTKGSIRKSDVSAVTMRTSSTNRSTAGVIP